MLFHVKIFVFLFFGIIAVKSDIHSEMSPTDLHHIFGSSDGSVPNYEVMIVEDSRSRRRRDQSNNLESNDIVMNRVTPNGAAPIISDPNYLSSKSGPDFNRPVTLPQGVHFETRSFGEHIEEWLYPGNGLLFGDTTPIYHADYSETEPEKVKFTRKWGLMEEFTAKLYENPESLTSLVIDEDETGRKRINGHIGRSNIVVKSLPDRIVDNYNKNSSSDKLYDLSEGKSYHVAYKVATEEGRTKLTNEDNRPEYGTDQRLKTTPVFPDYLYPELLLVIDHSMWQYYERVEEERDIREFLKYLVAFWNGVDLKFRSLKNPSIRYHVSGIVFSKDPRATPYISSNLISPSKLHATQALRDASRFFYAVQDKFPIESYDIAVIMTKLDLARDHSDQKPLKALSVFGGACTIHHDKKTTESIVLFRDDSVFSGIHEVTQQLAYMFGSSDRDIDNRKCKNSFGFIMASPRISTQNSADFSPCSRKSFHYRLQKNLLTCLYNNPLVVPLPNLMPGRMRDMRDQCIAAGYGEPCQDDDSICQNLHCLNEDGVCVSLDQPALDGTPCDVPSFKFCLHMSCVGM